MNALMHYLSDKLPRMGVRKKPTRGERHQMRVMWDWDTPGRGMKYILCGILEHFKDFFSPIFSSVGDTKAVSAA